MAKKDDPRQLSADEIVEVIETLIERAQDPSDYITEADQQAFYSDIADAQKVIDKLVGPERESDARWSTRHILVDGKECERLADDLAISVDEAHDFFIGEPVKEARAVASWALDVVDDALYVMAAEDPASYVNMKRPRGEAIAEMLEIWARTKHKGVYRRRQDERQGPPMMERVL
jgi:hypothetical protein